MKKIYQIYLLSFIILTTLLIILIADEAQAAKSFFESENNFDYFENLFNKKQKYILFLAVFLPSILFLKKRKWFLFILFVFFQLFTVIYWDALSTWIQNLAGDSISEINNFNYDYAKAWVYSIFNYLEPNFQIKNFIKFYLLGFIIFYLLLKIKFNNKINLVYLPSFFFGIFILFFISINFIHLIKNVNIQSTVKKNFNNSPKIYKSDKNINVIIFIGESTTSMLTHEKINNIKETFESKNLGKIINFENVYATHTHSTPSLLRALSFPKTTDKSNLLLPIIDRKSIPIFNFLENKITKNYISSTGKEGYNNLHYSIFFKKFNYQSFLKESNLKFEKEFFNKELKKRILEREDNNLFVFHSSVGHAPYYKNIPENYLKPDNDKFNNKSLIKVIGKKYNFNKDIHIPDYISNIDYTFDNIFEIITNINNKTPTVFIYFSDHGESIYTGNGHDSSRFVHEMLRIPFFIYFNEKFLNQNIDLYRKLNKQNDEILTVDILPKILLEIYNIDNHYKDYFDKKNKNYEKLIFKRKIKDKINMIDINFSKNKLSNKYRIINDKDTDLHVLATNLNKERICYHSSNTIARIKRGSIITDCLEFDLVIKNDNFFIYHPPKRNINFTLDEFMVNLDRIKTLWIDVKNVDEKNCNGLTDKLIKIKKNYNILVEFPSKTILKNGDISSCMKKLRNNNIDVSYYLPNTIIDLCLEDLTIKNENCDILLEKIKLIDKSTIINNVSFDYKFSKILKYFNFNPNNIKLNTWHINSDKVKSLNMKLYNLVIPYNSNFNNNTY